MSTSRFLAILATALFIAVACTAITGAPPADPKFVKFKREMLPQVGRKMTVVGRLDSGKLGWWLSSKEWGLYLYTTTTNRADLEKLNNGHRVKVTGVLRHSEYRDSGSPMVSSIPEHFFFDVAETVVSKDQAEHEERQAARPL